MIDKEDCRLLCAQDLAERLGVSRATLHRWNAGGRVPQPVRIGRTVRWPLDEIKSWILAGCPGRSVWETKHSRRTA